MDVKELEIMGVSSLSTLKTLTSSCLETMLGKVRAKMVIRKLHAIVRTRIRLSETISLGMQSPSADFVNRSVVTSVKGGGHPISTSKSYCCTGYSRRLSPVTASLEPTARIHTDA